MPVQTPPRAPVRPANPILFLAGALAIGLVEVGVLEYSYERIGLRPHVFGALLVASLLGSWINLPVAELSSRPGAVVTAGPGGGQGTLLAVNVGGAIVPAALSVYLLVARDLGWTAVLASAIVALVTHRVAKPIRGLGIVMPVFAPPLLAAVVAVALEPARAPALAYVAGTFGTLVGADLSNLSRLRALEAPVVSIGGAGTFDGIFLTGVLAVLLA